MDNLDCQLDEPCLIHHLSQLVNKLEASSKDIYNPDLTMIRSVSVIIQFHYGGYKFRVVVLKFYSGIYIQGLGT